MRALKKAFDSVEDLSIKSMDLQNPLHRPEDTWVIVDNDDQMACAHD